MYRYHKLIIAVIISLAATMPGPAWGLASNNVPLDSPIYDYLDKLSGFGLIGSDIHGIRPYTRSEAIRLVLEAEAALPGIEPQDRGLAVEILLRLRNLLPREADLYEREGDAPALDVDPLSYLRARYVHVAGVPRDYDRTVLDPGGEGVFGIGHVRPRQNSFATASGSEGTPLLENNEGTVYRKGENFELKGATELFVTRYASALAEPLFITSPGADGGRDTSFRMNRLYLKLGGKGLELEAGRDSNWLGQGFRHTLILSNNSPNMDLVKLSSPEPVGWKWLRRHVGPLRYAVIVSRLKESGSGADRRRPWFVAYRVSAKFTPDFEFGINVARQMGGPNVKVGGGFMGAVFGGVKNDGSNFVGGFDLRLRIPALRHTTVYFEYAGEDNAFFWPTVESYVAGVFVPRLTSDGKNDLRFEFYLGRPIEYTNYQYPEGYTNAGLVIGDSQGGDTKEYFARFTHYFSLRNMVALEYFHTQRGRLGRVGDQRVEEKDAARISCSLALMEDWGLGLNYGYENIRNLNLSAGKDRENHLFRAELCYRY